jgi:hypothetical protein
MRKVLCWLGIHQFLLVRWVRKVGAYRNAPTFTYEETVYRCSGCGKVSE